MLLFLFSKSVSPWCRNGKFGSDLGCMDTGKALVKHGFGLQLCVSRTSYSFTGRSNAGPAVCRSCFGMPTRSMTCVGCKSTAFVHDEICD